LTPRPEIAAAIIAEEEVSAAAAAAMRMLPEAFLVAAALSAMLGSGIVALRTHIFPKVWAWFSLLLALLLVIPPIGWAALLLGLPVWVIVTTVFLLRRGAPPANGGRPAVGLPQAAIRPRARRGSREHRRRLETHRAGPAKPCCASTPASSLSDHRLISEET